MLNIHEFIHNLDAYYKQVEKLAEKNSGQLIGFWVNQIKNHGYF